MTLTPTVPSTVSGLVATLSSMITDVNNLWGQVSANAWSVGFRELAMAALATEIACVDVPVEIIALTGAAAVDLEHMTGGRAGMLKILAFDDANVTVKHDPTKIILKGGNDLVSEAGNILALVNRDGDPDTFTDGYWRELFRTNF